MDNGRWMSDAITNQDGKIILITGAKGATVIMAVRNLEKGIIAVSYKKQE
ncbi:hypothetical protein SAMN05216312_101313 [Cohnella sp. OV330]|nr:hypothetical protein [Cohnella sp. OV330]SFA75762.1 hypothetical protein SAMN05216312_101313 [Cohnella sp. OV330]